MEMMKEVLSFYTPYASMERMEKALQTVLQEQINSYEHDDTSITIDLKDNEYLKISYVNDMQDESLFKNQIQRLYQSIAKQPCENKLIRQNLLYQIALFHGAYVIEFNYLTSDRDIKILPLMEIADKMDALIFWETGDISDSYGDVILSKKGISEVGVFNPVDGFDLTNKALGLSDIQLKRISRSLTILRYKGLYVPNNIAPPYDEQTYIFQDVDEMLKRCVACMVMAIYADFYRSHERNAEEAYSYVEKIIRLYRCAPFFTSAEIEMLNNQKPKDEDMQVYQGYYECCYTILWALGIMENLYFPSALCCDSLVVKTILGYDSLEKLKEQATLKSKAELLDAQDLVQRYVWACQDAIKLKFEMPAGLLYEIVKLRYKTLYWIANETDYSWDEVPCKIIPLSSERKVWF